MSELVLFNLPFLTADTVPQSNEWASAVKLWMRLRTRLHARDFKGEICITGCVLIVQTVLEICKLTQFSAHLMVVAPKIRSSPSSCLCGGSKMESLRHAVWIFPSANTHGSEYDSSWRSEVRFQLIIRSDSSSCSCVDGCNKQNQLFSMRNDETVSMFHPPPRIRSVFFCAAACSHPPTFQC